MSQGPGSSWRSRVVPGASDHGGQRDHPHQQREQHLGCPGSTAVAVGVGCGLCWAGYQIFSWIQFYQKYLRCQQDYKLQTTYLDNLSDTSCCSSKNVRWPVRLVVMGRYCNAPGWIRKKWLFAALQFRHQMINQFWQVQSWIKLATQLGKIGNRAERERWWK